MSLLLLRSHAFANFHEIFATNSSSSNADPEKITETRMHNGIQTKLKKATREIPLLDNR